MRPTKKVVPGDFSLPPETTHTLNSPYQKDTVCINYNTICFVHVYSL